MQHPILRGLRDSYDVLRHVRSPLKLGKLLLPARWRTLHVLNRATVERDVQIPSATEVTQALRKLKNQLKAELLADDGRIRYSDLTKSDAYAEMVRTSRLLPHVRPEEIEGDDERIAFWINLYNVLSIHGVGALGIQHSVMEDPTFFRSVAYQVGPWTFTPDEIENGVLRRNSPPPTSLLPLFAPDDPRLSTCPSRLDPRIHMALVCASTSCPPVAFYDAARLDAQLENSVANYIDVEISINDDRRCIEMPIVFFYYRDDFGGKEGILRFLLHYAGARKDAFEDAISKQYSLFYRRYDWSLNAMF